MGGAIHSLLAALLVLGLSLGAPATVGMAKAMAMQTMDSPAGPASDDCAACGSGSTTMGICITACASMAATEPTAPFIPLLAVGFEHDTRPAPLTARGVEPDTAPPRS